MSEGLNIVAAPHPFLTERICLAVEAGGSLADVLDRSGLKFPMAIGARICVNGLVIPQEEWENHTPADGDLITLMAIPRGGGGKNVLRIVMALAVIAAMPAAGALIGTGLSSALGGASTILGSEALFAGTVGMIQVGAGIGALALVNAMCPPPRPSVRSNDNLAATQSYGIEGAQNQLAPWNPVPCMLGKHRFTPPYAAKPYTEINGNDQYLHALFCVGYGPLDITEPKIGETDLTEFKVGDDPEDRLAFEIWSYFNPDTDVLKYFKDDCTELGLSIELKQADGYQTRQTEADIDEIGVDISAPQGMVQFDNDGDKLERTVDFTIEYKKTTESTWSVSRAGQAFSLRNSGTIEKPGQFLTRTGSHEDGWEESYSTGYSYTIIGIDKTSGEIKLYRRMTRNSLGVTVPKVCSSAVLAKSNCPRPPSYVAPLAGITRASNDNTIDAGDIDNTWRTTELDCLNPATDFLVSATPTPGDTINIATGTLYFKPQFRGATNNAIRRTYRFSVPNGTYDVRIRRETTDQTSDKIFDKIYWTCLRSIKNSSPIKLPGLALVEMRVKASDQLNGMINTFNCVAHSILPDWNTLTSTWVERLTSNPASLFRAVFQGPANKKKVPDSKINLTDLQAWHAECVSKGYTFNQPIDYQSTVMETAANVAAAGRASLAMRDGKYTIIQDKPRTAIIQHFTPHNSWGFKSSKNLLTIPHGFRVRFADEDAGWQSTERIVYADGYNDENATEFEELQLVGITDSDLAWMHGRFHLAQLILRPEEYSFQTDIENLACTRGDLIRVNHDAPMWGLASGRIKSVTINGNYATGIVIDETVTMEAGKSYAVRIRKADLSSLPANVNTVAGDTNTLAFTTSIPIANAPAKGDLVMFGEAGIESVELIVKGIQPGPNLTATITAVDYSPAIYNADTGAIPAFDPGISLPAAPHAPLILNCRSDEWVMVRQKNGTWVVRMLVTLAHPSNTRMHDVARIEGQYRVHDPAGPWIKLAQIPRDATEVSIYDVETGVTYEIRFRYVFRDGVQGPWTSYYEHTVIGKSGNPSDVAFDDANCVFQSNRITFRWLAIQDPDLDYYELRTDTNWGASAGLVTRTKATKYVYVNPLDINATYYIKARDTSGNYSTNADEITGDTDYLTVGTISTDFTTENLQISWAAVDPAKLSYYQVALYNNSDMAGGHCIHTSAQINYNHYEFTLAMNQAASGGPYRELWVRVTAHDIYGRTGYSDGYGINPAPPQITTLMVVTLVDGLILTCDPLYDDIIGYEFGCDTDDPPTTTQEVGTNFSTWLDLVGGTEYHVRVRAKDVFGYGAWSSIQHGTPETLTVDETDMDIPLTRGVVWSCTAGTLSWNAHEILFKGEIYSIPAGSTASAFVYWVSSSPTQYSSGSSVPVALDTWAMCYQNSNIAYPAQQGKIIHGGYVQVNTLNADRIITSTMTLSRITGSGSLTIGASGTLTIGSGGAFTVASGGQITISSATGINVSSGADITVQAGGKIKLAGNASTPGTLEIYKNALSGTYLTIGGFNTNGFRFTPSSDGAESLYLAVSGARWANIYGYATSLVQWYSYDGLALYATGATGLLIYASTGYLTLQSANGVKVIGNLRSDSSTNIARIATGSYTGNGSTLSRTITSSLGFTPKLVLIFKITAHGAETYVFMAGPLTDAGTGDTYSFTHGATQFFTAFNPTCINIITGGFAVDYGHTFWPNQNGVTYEYICIG